MVRSPLSTAQVCCGGTALIPINTARPAGAGLCAEYAEGSVAGRRYSEPDCGVELLCTRSGAGSLSADGRPLGASAAKKLPSSD